MTTYRITNRISGQDLGTFEGETERDALDAMARDAGYSDYDDACDAAGGDGIVAQKITGRQRFDSEEYGFDGPDSDVDAYFTRENFVDMFGSADLSDDDFEALRAEAHAALFEVDGHSDAYILERIVSCKARGPELAEMWDAGDLPRLEQAGLIEIHRPIHESTGIAYSQEYWSVTVTDEGLALIE